MKLLMLLLAMLLAGCSAPTSPSLERSDAQALLSTTGRVARPEPGSGVGQKLHLITAEATHDCRTLTIHGRFAAEAANPFPDPTNMQLKLTIVGFDEPPWSTFEAGPITGTDPGGTPRPAGRMPIYSLQTNTQTGWAEVRFDLREFWIEVPFEFIEDVGSGYHYAGGGAVSIELYYVDSRGFYSSGPRYSFNAPVPRCMRKPVYAEPS